MDPNGAFQKFLIKGQRHFLQHQCWFRRLGCDLIWRRDLLPCTPYLSSTLHDLPMYACDLSNWSLNPIKVHCVLTYVLYGIFEIRRKVAIALRITTTEKKSVKLSLCRHFYCFVICVSDENFVLGVWHQRFTVMYNHFCSFSIKAMTPHSKYKQNIKVLRKHSQWNHDIQEKPLLL